ncbi:MAG: hypothetical protein ACYCS1_04420 [Gammaproteobacteria bacterium]
MYLGLLYHLKSPLLGLEKIASVCKNELIVETNCIISPIKQPILKFEKGNSQYAGFVPNEAALRDMLIQVGFKKFQVTHKKPYNKLFGIYGTYGRITIKAYK